MNLLLDAGVPHLYLEQATVTPGDVPRVFDDHVVQASVLIGAISDSEYSVVYDIKLFTLIQDFIKAIIKTNINDAALVRVDILVIGSYCEDKWLFL